MPELPEVEVVRAGLDRWVRGRTIAEVAVLHPRAVRRHTAGAADLSRRLVGATVRAASRRGKYLWLPLSGLDEPITDPIAEGISRTADAGTHALLAHLGMSGQLLVQPPEAAAEKHLRVRISFTDGGRELRFVDQRTFGGLALEPLVADEARGRVPQPVRHIARDPLDPGFDDAVFIRGLRARQTGVKRALLDQSLISGIGNIYADESLWRARLHYAHPTGELTPVRLRGLLGHIRDVLTQALAAGGTSFDSLYVDVNGRSGHFERGLNAYGRRDLPCPRCGRPIRRESFMNRSSYRCPRCQRTPVRPSW